MRISEAGQFAKSQAITPGAKIKAPLDRLSPSQHLLYCILQAAQEDLQLATEAERISSHRFDKMKEDVLRWLDAPEYGPSRPVVTLADCCEALGWDVRATRKALIEIGGRA